MSVHCTLRLHEHYAEQHVSSHKSSNVFLRAIAFKKFKCFLVWSPQMSNVARIKTSLDFSKIKMGLPNIAKDQQFVVRMTPIHLVFSRCAIVLPVKNTVRSLMND